jgi:hypothetical protein
VTDNLRIWSQVEKTDPAHTKKVNQRGGFTAISAAYQIMRATEVFGPVGEGWGYDAGEPIFQGGVVFVPVTLWHGNRANTFGPMFGGAEWETKVRVDTDAAKKATTDALTKLLSQLGFNADVFLGRFDDNKYVAEVRAEFAAQPEQKMPNVSVQPEGPDWWGADAPGMSSAQAKREGWGDKLDEWLGFIPTIPTASAWKDWCAENAADIKRLPKGWRVMLREAAEERGVELGAIQSTNLKAA